MSILAGGTRALMDLLARRKLEERQQMLDALTMADKQRGWEQDQLRTEQGARQLDLQEKNQQLLREQDRANAERLKKADRSRVLLNVAQRMQPSESGVDPRLAQELEDEGLATGLIERRPGLSMPMPDRAPQPETKPGEIAPLPMSMGRAPLKVTPDTIASLGGTDYQMARKAAEERTATQVASAAEREKAREDTQAHQRDLAADRAALMTSIAALTSAGRNDARLMQQANVLRHDFEKVTKDIQGSRHSYNELKAVLGSGNPMSDIAAIYSFMRSLDPTSTIRESEADLARNAKSIMDRIQNYIPQLKSGRQLTPQQQKDMLAVGQSLLDINEQIYQRRVREFKSHAEAYTIDPLRVVGEQPGAAPFVGPQQPGGGDVVITGIRPKGK